MIFIRQTFADGKERLGTDGFIRLDARRSMTRLYADADWHMRARGWQGYNMYKATHLREDWKLLHSATNPEKAP